MDITPVGRGCGYKILQVLTMEHSEHDKNGTGDDESDDTAQQQHSVQPCQLQHLYSVRWYGTGKACDSLHDPACHSNI